MNLENPKPNGCLYKDHLGNAYFIWILHGKIPHGSVGINFRNKLDVYVGDMPTKEIQFVHALIIQKDGGIDPTKLIFQTYEDFTQVDFYIELRERIPITRKDGSQITTMDVAIEGFEVLTKLIENYMEKKYNENICNGGRSC